MYAGTDTARQGVRPDRHECSAPCKRGSLDRLPLFSCRQQISPPAASGQGWLAIPFPDAYFAATTAGAEAEADAAAAAAGAPGTSSVNAFKPSTPLLYWRIRLASAGSLFSF